MALSLLLIAVVRLVWVLFGYYFTGDFARRHLESAWFLVILTAVVAAALHAALPHESHGRDRQPGGAMLPAFLAASFLLYGSSLRIGLLSDDFVLLAASPFAPDWQFFRPLPLLIWSAVFPVAGAVGLHAINVFLHGLNAWMVSRLAASLLPSLSAIPVYAAGTVFLTFPAAVEAVAWNAGVFDVLTATCALVFLHALITRTQGSTAVAITAIAAALLSKETAVAIPAMGALVALRRAVNVRALITSAAVCVAYAAVRLQFAEGVWPDVPIQYFVKELIARPYSVLGVPWTAQEVSQSPLLFAFMPQLLLVALIAVYALRPGEGLMPLWAAVFVLIPVLPLLGYMFVSDYLEGGRYLYLPLIGWSLGLAALTSHGRFHRLDRMSQGVLAMMIAMGVYGAWTHQRTWAEAAWLRDRVLAAASEVVGQRACRTSYFAAVPDTVRGAYVFRNGFPEAVTRSTSLVTTSNPAEAECRFEWTGATFQPSVD